MGPFKPAKTSMLVNDAYTPQYSGASASDPDNDPNNGNITPGKQV